MRSVGVHRDALLPSGCDDAVLVGCVRCVRAQSPEFVPEIDTHVTLNHYMRTYLVPKTIAMPVRPANSAWGRACSFM